MKKIFELYEDDRFVLKGTVEDLAERLIISDSAIYMAAKSGTLLFKRLSVKQVGVVYENKQTREDQKPKPKKRTKHQQKLDYIIHRLNLDRITTLKGNPEDFIEELEKEGIKITYRKSEFGRKDYLLERV